jgi:hypothetical protein
MSNPPPPRTVLRAPVAGAMQYVIVGTAVERVGGSFPQSSSRPLPSRIVSAPEPPCSFVLPGAALHEVPPVPAVQPRVVSVSTVNLVNPAPHVYNVRSALPVDPVLATPAVHRIRPDRSPTRASPPCIR